MPREKREQKDLFNDITELSFRVRSLSGIVQNEGIPINDEEILEWSDLVNEVINKLSSVREDIIRFYQD